MGSALYYLVDALLFFIAGIYIIVKPQEVLGKLFKDSSKAAKWATVTRILGVLLILLGLKSLSNLL